MHFRKCSIFTKNVINKKFAPKFIFITEITTLKRILTSKCNICIKSFIFLRLICTYIVSHGKIAEIDMHKILFFRDNTLPDDLSSPSSKVSSGEGERLWLFDDLESVFSSSEDSVSKLTRKDEELENIILKLHKFKIISR